MSRPTLISIEANIGAGKSTVLKNLQKTLDPTYTTCIEEPIEDWNQYRDETGHTLLELYYKNPAKHAFALQTMIYNSLKRTINRRTFELARPVQMFDALQLKHPFTRPEGVPNGMFEDVNQTIAATYTPVILTERSLQSSNGIFAKMLVDSGIMSHIEYQVFENLVAADPIPLHACIYLRTQPEVCYERIRHRNRQGEQKIEMEYLQSCHYAHEAWIEGLTCTDTKVYVVEVGTKKPQQILDEVLKIVENLVF